MRQVILLEPHDLFSGGHVLLLSQFHKAAFVSEVKVLQHGNVMPNNNQFQTNKQTKNLFIEWISKTKIQCLCFSI